jgi:hypothetical protein
LRERGLEEGAGGREIRRRPYARVRKDWLVRRGEQAGDEGGEPVGLQAEGVEAEGVEVVARAVVVVALAIAQEEDRELGEAEGVIVAPGLVAAGGDEVLDEVEAGVEDRDSGGRLQ